jgi:hypothetical protein
MAQRIGDAKRARGIRGVSKVSNYARAQVISSRYNRRYGYRGSGLQRAPGVPRELGYVDVTTAGYAMDTTGSVTQLNVVAQGAGVTQRVGKKIVLKGLQARGNMSNNSAATVNDVAFMIVYDKRPTGALPAVTDILTAASAFAMNNDANSGRFKILKRVDDVLVGNASAAASYLDGMYKPCDFYLDLKNLQTTFKAAGTGAIGDVEEGALYLVTVGSTAAGTGAAGLQIAFRLRFMDV